MNIFFDLDGTLTDSQTGIINTVKHMLKVHDKPIPTEDLSWVVGPPFEESVSNLLGTKDKEAITNAIKTYRSKYLEVGIYENKLFPTISEILETLYESHTLFIATTKPKPQAEIVLKHFGIRDFFKSVYGSNLDGSMSDKKILLAHALKKENIQSKDSVMIGDRIFDIEGAKSNGIPAVAATWGYGKESEYKNADYTIDSPEEFIQTISDLVSIHL